MGLILTEAHLGRYFSLSKILDPSQNRWQGTIIL